MRLGEKNWLTQRVERPPKTQYIRPQQGSDPAQRLASRAEMRYSCVPRCGRLQAMPAERGMWRTP